MVPRLLQITGLVLIIAGVFLGFNSQEVEVLGEVEKSSTVLFAWIGVGLFSGFLLIGLGEVIYKIEDLIKKPK